MKNIPERAAALADLRDWAVRRAKLEEDRPALMAAAWKVGARSVAELARTAGVSRDTVYADLRRQGIDYYNRDQDPRLTRLVQAVAALAMQFNPGNPLSWKTAAAFGPPLSEAAALLVSFQGPDLIDAVRKVLAVTYGNGDEHYLSPYLDELRAALDGYLRVHAAIPPIKRVLRGRSAGHL
jgi:DNA-binding phage protein